MDNFLNELLCGFRESHSTQHVLFKLEQDISGFIRTILRDLSKAYYSLPYDLLITKLGAEGLERSSLILLMDYLNSRKQQTKLVHPTTIGLKLNTEFCKFLYWDTYYSIYLQTSYSLAYKSLMLAILRMIKLCTLVE